MMLIMVHVCICCMTIHLEKCAHSTTAPRHKNSLLNFHKMPMIWNHKQSNNFNWQSTRKQPTAWTTTTTWSAVSITSPATPNLSITFWCCSGMHWLCCWYFYLCFLLPCQLPWLVCKSLGDLSPSYLTPLLCHNFPVLCVVIFFRMLQMWPILTGCSCGPIICGLIDSLRADARWRCVLALFGITNSQEDKALNKINPWHTSIRQLSMMTM